MKKRDPFDFSRGMVSKLTTWNNATVGSGTILNQMQNVYNQFGQQTNSYQAHDGSVTVGTTPEVRYNYYHGGGNRIRIAGMTYPNGRDLTYDYGVADGTNDASSRIESIINNSDSLNLATYQYLGASGFVNVASSQPGINWTLYGTSNDPNTGDIYSGLDRFGRVDNCLWKQGTTTLAQIQYGYDRASNRTWRKDGVLTGYDELYAYDGLYRLNDQKRGTLNGTQTAITSGKFEQQWGLDATGNWKTFKQDNDGNGTWELNQTRNTNKANEITGITNSVGAAWATPTYDPAGNMAGIPNPQSLTAEYDAWNRLVVIKDGATKICENVYDARGYRIRKDTYTSGTLSEARHYYYTPGWQCVEERTGTLTTVERQFVWGLRYIDDLVLRDRSTANNGVINERRYAMQDGNWNTIAICAANGVVSERYAYSAYGTPVFMTGAGVVQTSSAIGFETLYAGYRWDGTTPQMYYVRNRFLLPMIGTWNRRDPLGYVDGMSLYEYAISSAMTVTDPYGTWAGKRAREWYDPIYPNNNGILWIEWEKFKGDLIENGAYFLNDYYPEFHVGCNTGKIECRDVQFIQVASVTNRGLGTTRIPIDVRKDLVQLPGGEDLRWRTEIQGPPGERCGVFLDAPLQEGQSCSPYYSNTGHKPRVGPYIIDTPGSNLPTNDETYVLEACAICVAGPRKGQIIGCIEWGYRTVFRGRPAYSVVTPPIFRNQPTALWNQTVEKYREEFDPENLTFPKLNEPTPNPPYRTPKNSVDPFEPVSRDPSYGK